MASRFVVKLSYFKTSRIENMFVFFGGNVEKRATMPWGGRKNVVYVSTFEDTPSFLSDIIVGGTVVNGAIGESSVDECPPKSTRQK